MILNWFLTLIVSGISLIPLSYLVARVVFYAYFHEKLQYQVRFMRCVSCVDDKSGGKAEVIS